MQERGLQDDVAYAKDFVAAKWRASHWAPARLRMALALKGVCAADADAAIDWLLAVRPRAESLPRHTTVCRHVHDDAGAM